MVRPGLVLVATLSVLSCATLGVGGGRDSETRERFSRAVTALDRSDFESATPDLEWLVARCRSGKRARTALLLLAAAELDVRNPERSPGRARRYAEAYLSLPGIPDEELPVARTLYLLAVDLGGTAIVGEADSPPVADRFADCGEGEPRDHLGLPTYDGPTTARRLATLQDSLDVLQAEIDRVRKLLKGGGGGPDRRAMSVRIRLLAGFAVVTALMLLPVLFAAARLAELRDLAVEGRGRHAAAVLAVGHLQTDIAELDRDERSYLITGEPVLRTSVEDEISRMRLELDSLGTSPYAKPAADVDPIFDSIADLSAKIHGLMQQDRVAEATGTFNRLEPLLVEGRQRVRALAGAIDRIAQADFRRAEAISASARQSTLAGVAFFVLVAILVGAWTTYALVRPLGRLAEATAAVAGGRLEDPPELPYHRKDEIGTLSTSFRAMTRRLAELDRMKAEFVGVASHELKTPINVINGYTELIEEETQGELTEHQIQILDGILEQTRAMSRLVSRLMDISRLEAGTYRMEFDVVHVEDVVTGLLRSFDVLARAKGVGLQAQIHDSTPETAVLDIDIIRDEVLGNLVSNALRHTPGGRVDRGGGVG